MAEQSYNTPNGQRTIAQMTAELQHAGYGGPWDGASVVSAYNRTASGGRTASTNQGLSDLINAALAANTEDLALRKQDAERNYQLALDNLQLAQNSDQRAQAMLDLQIARDTLSKLQFEEQKQMNRANVAMQLVQTGASLRGPRDYQQFQQAMAGGKTLLQQLRGTEAQPAFGAPQGELQPATIDDILQRLGLGPMQQPSAQGAQQPSPSARRQVPRVGSADLARFTVDPGKLYDDFMKVDAQWRASHGGQRMSEEQWAMAMRTLGVPGTIADALGDAVYRHTGVFGQGPGREAFAGIARSIGLGGATTPVAAPTSATQAPAVPTTSPTPAASPTPATPTPAVPATSQPRGPNRFMPPPRGEPIVVSPTSAAGPRPVRAAEDPLVAAIRTGQMLPHQINPGVWNQLGPVGRGLTQSAAEAAGWDWGEFERQHYAARPYGIAPRRVRYDYAPLAGAFG